MNGKSTLAFASALLIAASVSVAAAHRARALQNSAGAPPGAQEMQRLKAYVGEWDYTETYEKSPAFPNGGKNTGVYTSKLGPGGNSLVNTFHSQGPVGDFEGLIVMTWDVNEKAYKEYAFGNDLPGAIVQTGQFEGDALVFRAEVPAGANTFKMRNVTRFLDGGKLVAEQFFTAPGAPEAMFVHVEGKKR